MLYGAIGPALYLQLQRSYPLSKTYMTTFQPKLFLLWLPLYFSCTNNTSKANTAESDSITTVTPAAPAGGSGYTYDLSKPTHTRRLPADLVEVSGNTWIDADHLILIEDLHPDLYLIKLGDTSATLEKKIPFAETDKDKLDIEDVAIADNTIYALWSHGVLFKITDWRGNPHVDKIETGLAKENNTEGLCYDPVTKKLLIACKDAPGVEDEKKSAKAVYQFDIGAGKLISTPYMMIHKKDFEGITGDKLAFNPSAIAVHPITHDIYILTTRDNKGMAVFSHDGVLKSYQTIAKELMPQPEGICFSPEGKLYISSEGKQGEAGNLFEFQAK